MIHDEIFQLLLNDTALSELQSAAELDTARRWAAVVDRNPRLRKLSMFVPLPMDKDVISIITPSFCKERDQFAVLLAEQDNILEDLGKQLVKLVDVAPDAAYCQPVMRLYMEGPFLSLCYELLVQHAGLSNLI